VGDGVRGLAGQLPAAGGGGRVADGEFLDEMIETFQTRFAALDRNPPVA
jgi:hypothetical protein